MSDRKAILSATWTFVMFNYLYADLILFFTNPAYLEQLTRIGAWVMLGVVAIFELSIAMLLLSRVLPYRVNRWANIIIGAESTAFVAFTLIGGTLAAPWYVFVATIEMLSTLFIVWFAWTWTNSES